MNYEKCTNENSNYTQWLVTLVSLICESANLLPSQLAITEREVKEYYKDGKTPFNVFYNIWFQDAGNYMAI